MEIVRKMQLQDLDIATQIVTETIGTCNVDDCENIATEEEIFNRNKKYISKNIHNMAILEKDSQIIAVSGLGDILDDFFGIEKAREVLFLCVDKNFQRQGYGTKLLKEIIKNVNENIVYEAWGDNGKYVNSHFVLEKLGFSMYKDLGTYYFDNHYCHYCINRNIKCNPKNCLCQIWLKNKSG